MASSQANSRTNALVCVIVIGSHRLPLFLIGKSKTPMCYKGIKKMPAIYKNQKSLWVETGLFVEWYDKVFIPGVKKHHRATGNFGDVLLLIERPKSSMKYLSGKRKWQIYSYFCALERNISLLTNGPVSYWSLQMSLQKGIASHGSNWTGLCI